MLPAFMPSLHRLLPVLPTHPRRHNLVLQATSYRPGLTGQVTPQAQSLWVKLDRKRERAHAQESTRQHKKARVRAHPGAKERDGARVCWCVLAPVCWRVLGYRAHANCVWVCVYSGTVCVCVYSGTVCVGVCVLGYCVCVCVLGYSKTL